MDARHPARLRVSAPRRPGAIVVVAAWALLAAISAWTLAAPPDHAGDRLGWRRFATPAVAPDLSLAQTFQMTLPNLNAIDLRATAVGPVGGRIRLELIDFDREGGSAPSVIRTAEIDAKDLVQRELYRFQFDPIAESQRHVFRLDISSSSNAPSQGVAFWATRGERYGAGTLVANDRERWADLAFQTHTPARSTLTALFDRRDVPFASGVIALAGLLVSWLALGVILREAATSNRTA